MKTMLANQFDVQASYMPDESNRQFLTDGQYVYHIIRADSKKAIYMEQATLSWLLLEKGYQYIARVMPNIQGEWITHYKGIPYLVMQAMPYPTSNALTHGEALAHFHQWGTSLEYEPDHLSSYGLWKQLWITKLDQYEQAITELALGRDSAYVNLLLDILPYMIGVSENAIQYIQESEAEWRMNGHDYGTVVFHRYNQQVLGSVIWPHELIFDHGIRDVAEMIRYYWLFEGEEGERKAIQLITDYQTVRPFSTLAWRGLYARLLMPLHLFDVIGESLLMDDHDASFDQLTGYLDMQSAYEVKLSHMFDYTDVNIRALNLPVIQWL